MARPLLLDTDIGTDVDDAIAIALLLSAPELLVLVAVTTVAGDLSLLKTQVTSHTSTLEDANFLLRTLGTQLGGLLKMVEDEVVARQQQRALERDTLLKLTRYLDEWVYLTNEKRSE